MAVANSVYDEIRQQGGEIVLVTPDQPEDLKRTIDRLGISYPVLADPEFQAIDAYNLRHKDAIPGKDSTRPAIFFVRADGTVSGSIQIENYRKAPTAEEILAGFRQAAVTSP